MLRKIMIIGVVGLTLAGCAEINRFHGFVPPQHEIDDLQVGVSSKADIISVFGAPVADRSLQSNTIYYAQSQFRTRGPLAPELVDRQVLALDFDSADRLRNISRYGIEDGRVIVLDRRVTEDGIDDVTFLSQLLGSFGRFDAGTLLGDEPQF